MIFSRFAVGTWAQGFAALAAAAVAAPVLAQSGDEASRPAGLAAGANESGDTVVLGQQERPLAPATPRVTISRAADLVGRTTYPSSSRFADKAAVVELSARPRSPAGRIVGMPSQMPLAGGAMTSGFGARRHPLSGDWRAHSGVDLAAPAGSPVVATADGSVSIAGWSGGYGLLVALEHGGGVETRYAHLSRLNVSVGQTVQAGEVIGFVGSTGRSTGPHLHYETRINGRAVDPLSD